MSDVKSEALEAMDRVQKAYDELYNIVGQHLDALENLDSEPDSDEWWGVFNSAVGPFYFNTIRAALEQKADPAAWLPERLSREQAGPLCELLGCADGKCDCYRDCEGNVRLQEAWTETRRLILNAAPPSTAEADEPSYDEAVEHILRGADNIAGVISNGQWSLDGDEAPDSIIRDFLDQIADMLSAAGARINENNDGLVFPAQPSTAEVEARALENFAEEYKKEADDMSAMESPWAKTTSAWLRDMANRLRLRAKRIREQAND